MTCPTCCRRTSGTTWPTHVDPPHPECVHWCTSEGSAFFFSRNRSAQFFFCTDSRTFLEGKIFHQRLSRFFPARARDFDEKYKPHGKKNQASATFRRVSCFFSEDVFSALLRSCVLMKNYCCWCRFLRPRVSCAGHFFML